MLSRNRLSCYGPLGSFSSSFHINNNSNNSSSNGIARYSNTCMRAYSVSGGAGEDISLKYNLSTLSSPSSSSLSSSSFSSFSSSFSLFSSVMRSSSFNTRFFTAEKSTPLLLSRRYVQFQQTSETLGGINRNRSRFFTQWGNPSGETNGNTNNSNNNSNTEKETGKKKKVSAATANMQRSTKWITKSTQDYMSEAQAAGAATAISHLVHDFHQSDSADKAASKNNNNNNNNKASSTSSKSDGDSSEQQQQQQTTTAKKKKTLSSINTMSNLTTKSSLEANSKRQASHDQNTSNTTSTTSNNNNNNNSNDNDMDVIKPAEGIMSAWASTYAARRAEVQKTRAVMAAAEDLYSRELQRMHEDSGRQWEKSIRFFKRQGTAFILCYIAAYLGVLAALYFGFSTGILPKEHAFDFLFLLFSNYLDRDAFYSRVERWDTCVNFGFAFVVNEMLELARFPLMCVLFFQIKTWRRARLRTRPSIFKASAPHT